MIDNESLRLYGAPPFKVVVVHGGPGAPGEMKPMAKELSHDIGVLEPLQTAFSVDGQVTELASVIEARAAFPVILIGWSWGAWLSFIVTARYPSLVEKLILVSSGPFKAEYAQQIMPTRLSRLSPDDRMRAEALLEALQAAPRAESGALFSEFGQLLSSADSFSPLPSEESDAVRSQPEIFKRVWVEADRLRATGTLLQYGQYIQCPVVVIHGDYDPHPFMGVREPLSEVVKNCRFILLERCGHHPWYEREAKEQFYKTLRLELSSPS